MTKNDLNYWLGIPLKSHFSKRFSIFNPYNFLLSLNFLPLFPIYVNLNGLILEPHHSSIYIYIYNLDQKWRIIGWILLRNQQLSKPSSTFCFVHFRFGSPLAVMLGLLGGPTQAPFRMDLSSGLKLSPHFSISIKICSIQIKTN